MKQNKLKHNGIMNVCDNIQTSNLNLETMKSPEFRFLSCFFDNFDKYRPHLSVNTM